MGIFFTQSGGNLEYTERVERVVKAQSLTVLCLNYQLKHLVIEGYMGKH